MTDHKLLAFAVCFGVFFNDGTVCHYFYVAGLQLCCRAFDNAAVFVCTFGVIFCDMWTGLTDFISCIHVSVHVKM